MSCEKCDWTRQRENRTTEVGKPCDICNDTGTDYLGRPCRHLCPLPPFHPFRIF